MPLATKRKVPDREELLAEARVIHESIVKRMTKAGYSYSRVRRDLKKVLLSEENDNSSRN